MMNVDSSDDDLYIAAITESVVIDVSEIRHALDTDSELILVKEAIITEDWSNETIKSGAK